MFPSAHVGNGTGRRSTEPGRGDSRGSEGEVQNAVQKKFLPCSGENCKDGKFCSMGDCRVCCCWSLKLPGNAKVHGNRAVFSKAVKAPGVLSGTTLARCEPRHTTNQCSWSKGFTSTHCIGIRCAQSYWGEERCCMRAERQRLTLDTPIPFYTTCQSLGQTPDNGIEDCWPFPSHPFLFTQTSPEVDRQSDTKKSMEALSTERKAATWISLMCESYFCVAAFLFIA